MVLGVEDPEVACCEELGVVVALVLDGDDDDAPTPALKGVVPDGRVEDANRPIPATRPPPRSPRAADSAVHAPLSTIVRRSMRASSRWRAGGDLLAR